MHGVVEAVVEEVVEAEIQAVVEEAAGAEVEAVLEEGAAVEVCSNRSFAESKILSQAAADSRLGARQEGVAVMAEVRLPHGALVVALIISVTGCLARATSALMLA